MKLFFNLLIFCLPLFCFTQDKILGKVISETGTPMSKANVFISNTKIGVYSNANGEFKLDNLPAGNLDIVISYIGYEIISVSVPVSGRSKYYLIQMQRKSNELSNIIVGKYDKRGWKKWGNEFTEAFIGTSAYSKNCIITNKEAIRFIYNEKTKQLHAYSNEPLIIENKSLGYYITVTLINFAYNLSDKSVDYKVYSLFKDMPATEDQQIEWEKERANVYSLSFMHFMRALYNQNFRNEGFQVRIIERSPIAEKKRIQELYKNRFTKIKDSSDTDEIKDNDINKLIENSFERDSLIYYKSILAQNDRTENLHLELCSFKDIAKQTDNNTVLFRFNDYLQITYLKAKEPKEYVIYKNKLYASQNILYNNDQRIYPGTELSLTQGIPLEINENGYFDNIDLFMQGFWGWWEKIATTLPYEYEP